MIKISVDIKPALRKLDALQRKQVPFAAALALTKTAKDLEDATRKEMQARFDRPTPFTLKSLRTKPATKRDLYAMVYLKDRVIGGKNPRSMSDIIGHQFAGGVRQRKQLEFVLRQQGFIAPNEYVVPGAAAKLDRYGNISRGQIVQILSQLGVKRSGYDSTPTQSKRSKRNVAKAGQIFWSRGPQGKRTPLIDKTTGIEYGYAGGAASHLPKGAWIRDGRTVHPILRVVSNVSYKQRINLKALADRVISQRLQGHFNTALATALRTAR